MGLSIDREKVIKEWKVPVQLLIDHIKTAIDVDDWAKEMAEDLLKEQEAVVRCKDCRKNMMCEMTIHKPKDWFCADGERR